jgi:uncharacterized HhH-GPD family protein
MGTWAIRDTLIKRGEELLAWPFEPVRFTSNPDANTLLNDLDRYPHAFVIACLMDRQWKAEKCWLVPFRFQERFGSFEFDELAVLSPDDVVSLFVQHPPLHRMKEIMAGIFYSAVQKIGEQYSGDASQIWQGTLSSAAIVRRFLEFEGAGPKIATMATNILVREFKIPVSDQYSIDLSVDVQVRRTFERLGLVRKGASKEELVYVARELNPAYPGVFDLPTWEIGRNWCRPKSPECAECYMQTHCPMAKKVLQ